MGVWSFLTTHCKIEIHSIVLSTYVFYLFLPPAHPLGSGDHVGEELKVQSRLPIDFWIEYFWKKA